MALEGLQRDFDVAGSKERLAKMSGINQLRPH